LMPSGDESAGNLSTEAATCSADKGNTHNESLP
jgi:hypothetical protein